MVPWVSKWCQGRLRTGFEEFAIEMMIAHRTSVYSSHHLDSRCSCSRRSHIKSVAVKANNTNGPESMGLCLLCDLVPLGEKNSVRWSFKTKKKLWSATTSQSYLCLCSTRIRASTNAVRSSDTEKMVCRCTVLWRGKEKSQYEKSERPPVHRSERKRWGTMEAWDISTARSQRQNLMRSRTSFVSCFVKPPRASANDINLH